MPANWSLRVRTIFHCNCRWANSRRSSTLDGSSASAFSNSAYRRIPLREERFASLFRCCGSAPRDAQQCCARPLRRDPTASTCAPDRAATRDGRDAIAKRRSPILQRLARARHAARPAGPAQDGRCNYRKTCGEPGSPATRSPRVAGGQYFQKPAVTVALDDDSGVKHPPGSSFLLRFVTHDIFENNLIVARIEPHGHGKLVTGGRGFADLRDGVDQSLCVPKDDPARGRWGARSRRWRCHISSPLTLDKLCLIPRRPGR